MCLGGLWLFRYLLKSNNCCLLNPFNFSVSLGLEIVQIVATLQETFSHNSKRFYNSQELQGGLGDFWDHRGGGNLKFILSALVLLDASSAYTRGCHLSNIERWRLSC